MGVEEEEADETPEATLEEATTPVASLVGTPVIAVVAEGKKASEEEHQLPPLDASKEETNPSKEAKVGSPTSSIPRHHRDGRRNIGDASPMYPPRISHDPTSITDMEEVLEGWRKEGRWWLER